MASIDLLSSSEESDEDDGPIVVRSVASTAAATTASLPATSCLSSGKSVGAIIDTDASSVPRKMPSAPAPQPPPQPPPPPTAARWLWQSGSDAWSEFTRPQAAALERAFSSGGVTVQVDAERQVDVRRMRQERIGAPGRSRAVRREPAASGGAAAPPPGAPPMAAVGAQVATALPCVPTRESSSADLANTSAAAPSAPTAAAAATGDQLTATDRELKRSRSPRRGSGPDRSHLPRRD